MQVYVQFSDERAIPLLTRETLDTLIDGISKAMRKGEKISNTLMPWLFRLGRGRKIYTSFVNTILNIFENKDLSIVFFCGDAYGSLGTFTELVGNDDEMKKRYRPISIPYVESRAQRSFFGDELVDIERRNLIGMQRRGIIPVHSFEDESKKQDSMYYWGAVPFEIVMKAKSCFYDDPILSSKLLRELFRWFWEHLPPELGVKPVLHTESHTLRDRDGMLPERWQSHPYQFENRLQSIPYLQDPRYYETYIKRIFDRLSTYKCSVATMHVVCATHVRKSIEEAMFFSKWEETLYREFSCRNTEFREID